MYPSLQQIARSLIKPLREFVYPPACLACEAVLPDGVSRICPTCWNHIRHVHRDDALYGDMRQRLLADGSLADMASAFYFEKEGTLQTLIHRLKYDEMTIVGEELGKHVASSLAALLPVLPHACLLPVPLHRAKERERGYNQSTAIARGIYTITGLPVRPHILRRQKNTISQTHLNPEERRANVRDAFVVRDPAAVRDRVIILVDDVITTGATILECARVLQAHHASAIYAASVALALPTTDIEA